MKSSILKNVCPVFEVSKTVSVRSARQGFIAVAASPILNRFANSSGLSSEQRTDMCTLPGGFFDVCKDGVLYCINQKAHGTSCGKAPDFGATDRRISASSFAEMGFEMYASMPEARHFSRSPFIACAVMATIGMCRPVVVSLWRMIAVASNPPISG